jgi:catechol 2,3-dioxygenase-like lactoylglutathione lyase family enzyme
MSEFKLGGLRTQVALGNFCHPDQWPMKSTLSCALIVLAATLASAGDRPRITAIDHADFYTTAPDRNKHLYVDVLGFAAADPNEPGQTQRFLVGRQFVGYSPAVDLKSSDRMDHVAFATNSCAALRSYLAAQGVKVPADLVLLKDGTPSFLVNDPDGHRVEFVERAATGIASGMLDQKSGSVSRHMIHVGLVVRDRRAADHFYREILGFHVYWQGGMQSDRTDWVAMQVPDGTDWLEYMLNIKPDADLRTTGVMNHISLGVKDMKQAQALLEARGWKPHGNERMQMGRDGKWQLNLYDPDYTRIELMEFKPVEKPCCSEFTGPHPTE